MKALRRVVIESPYAGDIEANTFYARSCLYDSLLRGEAPLASHLLYTQPGVLHEDVPEERAQGIAAGTAWVRVAQALIVYDDFGIAPGTQKGIDLAKAAKIPIEYRRIK